MAHPDLDELTNLLLPFAQEMLKKHGEFFPFGGSMNTSEEIAYVGGHTADEQPSSQDVIDLLLRGFREQAKSSDLRAAAICFDVRTIPPGQSVKADAICVRLEHSNGEAVHVFLPYRRGSQERYSFGELFAERGERDIFVSTEGA